MLKDFIDIRPENWGGGLDDQEGSFGFEYLNQVTLREINFGSRDGGGRTFTAAGEPIPEDGFTIYLHPLYEADKSVVPALVLYQLVVINYGDFASSDDAETFGSQALGLTREDYYQKLCALADRLPTAEAAAPSACGCSHG